MSANAHRRHHHHVCNETFNIFSSRKLEALDVRDDLTIDTIVEISPTVSHWTHLLVFWRRHSKINTKDAIVVFFVCVCVFL